MGVNKIVVSTAGERRLPRHGPSASHRENKAHFLNLGQAFWDNSASATLGSFSEPYHGAITAVPGENGVICSLRTEGRMDGRGRGHPPPSLPPVCLSVSVAATCALLRSSLNATIRAERERERERERDDERPSASVASPAFTDLQARVIPPLSFLFPRKRKRRNTSLPQSIFFC